MSCPKDKILLYLTKELSPEEEIEVKAHLEQCTECRKVLDAQVEALEVLENLRIEKPSAHIRQIILKKAYKNNRACTTELRTTISKGRFFTARKLAWGFVVTSVIVLFAFIFRPIRFIEESKNAHEITWQDNFFAHTDWLKSEIDRVESGTLLTEMYSNQSNTEYMDEERLSTMSDQLIWMRGQINTLTQNTIQ